MCVPVTRRDGVPTPPAAQMQKVPALSTIESWMPKNVFHKDVALSSFYLVRDASAVVLGMGTLWLLAGNASFQALPFLVRLVINGTLQCLTGFSMWCLFVVGHDAGHGTYSDSWILNRVVGEISHSVFLCTPFIPWKLSHHQHHLNHNHETKDYSHFWIRNIETWLEERPFENRFTYFLRPLLPFLAWPVYLYSGGVDGSHILCGIGRLWEGRPKWQIADGWISASITMTTMYTIVTTLGWSALQIYLAPWLIFSFFLFTVTYLQHHEPDTVVYGDETWSYVRGGFETVDRTFGAGIDDIHHNITDGHVIHHLFFTKIPHYHLSVATKALKDGLERNKLSNLYKHQDTRNFVPYIFSYVTNHFFCIPPKNVRP